MANKVLTDEQLKEMLDAKIRESARWKIRDAVEDGEPGGLMGGAAAQLQVNSKKLKIVANKIYDDMMSDLSWGGGGSNDRLLDAMNSLGKGKFNARYVERVIKKALKAETLKLEDAKLDGQIADLVDEACKSKYKGKYKGKRKG